jgi:Plasma-membrane choline transporter
MLLLLCAVGVHLASIGEITTKEVNGVDVKQIKYSDQIQGRGWYMLFCLFWTTEFITAMGQVSVILHILALH